MSNQRLLFPPPGDNSDREAGEGAAPGRAPHDAFFKEFFGNADMVRAFLRERLPPEIARLLADAPPVRVVSTFVEEGLRLAHSDLVYRVALKGGDYFYAVFEHKSWPDLRLFRQLASYQRGIWRYHASRGEGRTGSPVAVLPIVIYHGVAAWNPGEAHADWNAVRDVLKIHAQHTRCLFFSLGQEPQDALAEDPRLWAGLALLRSAGRPAEFGGAELQRVFRILRDERELTNSAAQYIVRVLGAGSLPQVEAAVRAAYLDQWEAVMETISQMWERERKDGWIIEGMAKGRADGLAEGRADGLAEGKAEGLAEGRADGLAEGTAKAKADDIIKLLEYRFGPLKAAVRERIETASVGELDSWVIRVLDATSPEAIFGGGG